LNGPLVEHERDATCARRPASNVTGRGRRDRLGIQRLASRTHTLVYNSANVRIPRTSRRRSPEAPAGARKSPQDGGRKALHWRQIPAFPRPARRRQDRPVTPEVAGSSPVAPVKAPVCRGTCAVRTPRPRQLARPHAGCPRPCAWNDVNAAMVSPCQAKGLRAETSPALVSGALRPVAAPMEDVRRPRPDAVASARCSKRQGSVAGRATSVALPARSA